MKKLIFFIIMLFMSSMCFAQVTLTQEQVNALPQEVQHQLQSVSNQPTSKYVGLGKEIGEAINSSLDAIEEHVVSLSKTKLGKTVIFILCWKLLYKDILQTVVGTILLILFIITLIKELKFIKNYGKDTNYANDVFNAHVTISCVTSFVLFIASMMVFFA